MGLPIPECAGRRAGQPGTRPGHPSLHPPGSGQRPLSMAEWPGVEMRGTAGLKTNTKARKAAVCVLKGQTDEQQGMDT